jgi:hypothetical protein
MCRFVLGGFAVLYLNVRGSAAGQIERGNEGRWWHLGFE